ncbi:MAG: transcription antitermination factor NusB, partial [Bacteroidales bacterium]|nr:transcription antitermination factor NusB [Bacteroidales bacterium]
MHNRRLIRVKVFKILFAYRASGNNSVESAEKELMHSFEVTRDLYYFLLNICPMLKKVAKAKLDAAKNKFHPTEEEANPNYKFVNNRFIKALEEDEQFGKICRKKGLEWSEYDVFVKKFYANMV